MSAAKKKPRRGVNGGKMGPPPTDPALVAAGLELVRAGRSPEEAAEKLTLEGRSVSSRTLRRNGATARGGAPAASSPPKPPPIAPPAGSQAAASATALPQGGAVSGRPDLLELLRRIGQARQARAWGEIEEGLRVHVAGGEEALVSWLLRPVEAVEVGVDELAALGRALDLAIELLGRAEYGGPALRVLREVASLSKSLATVRAKRPHEPKPDEVDERVRGAMDTCVEWLLLPVREAAAKLTRDRIELHGWAAQNLGPTQAAELRQRLDAMLAGAPS